MHRIIAILFLLFFSLMTQAQELIPYTDGKLWGYCDTNGTVVIAPQWKMTNFFEGNRAAVSFNELNAPRHYSIIDRNGNYIVPPEYHWNGEWFGWGYTNLNAQSDNAHYGLVDTAGKLIVPMLYQYPVESGYNAPKKYNPMLIVRQSNKEGAINSGGQLIVSCEWDKVWYTGTDTVDGYFVVTRSKLTGLLDPHGKQILPPAYTYLYPSGKNAVIVFQTDTATNKTLYGLVSIRSTKKILPLEYDELRPITDSLYVVRKKEQYAVYSLTGKRILDYTTNEYSAIFRGNQRPLAEYNYSNDTIVEQKAIIATDDRNTPQQFRYISTRTLKPISDWIVWHNNNWTRPCHPVEVPVFVHYPPRVRINGLDTTWFHLDSIDWQTSYLVNQDKQYYSVQGKTKGNGNIVAIVDQHLLYLFKPVTKDITIVNYNEAAGHIVYKQGYNERYGVMDTTGNIIAPLQSAPIIATVCSGGQTYIISLSEREDRIFSGYPYIGQKRRIARADKQAVPQLSRYDILDDNENSTVFEGHYFRVANKTGMQGFVDISGKVLFPKLSFKYKYALPVTKGFFLVGNDKDDPRKMLVNDAGINKMKAVLIHSIRPANLNRLFPADPVKGYRVLPSLLEISGTINGQDKYFRFYMTRSGKVYTNGFER